MAEGQNILLFLASAHLKAHCCRIFSSRQPKDNYGAFSHIMELNSIQFPFLLQIHRCFMTVSVAYITQLILDLPKNIYNL